MRTNELLSCFGIRETSVFLIALVCFPSFLVKPKDKQAAVKVLLISPFTVFKFLKLVAPLTIINKILK